MASGMNEFSFLKEMQKSSFHPQRPGFNIFTANIFLLCDGEQFLSILKEFLLFKYIFKVLSLLEACFDLMSSPSPSMKIQILGRKITENLVFESPL